MNKKMKSPKVFNCTTNVVGGAIQNAVNFILELINRGESEQWYFLLSEKVYLQLHDNLNLINYSVYQSPAKSILARLKIKNDVFRLNPSVVYTSAGPAYVNFTCKHIMGCSNPYVLGTNINFENGFFKKTLRYLHTKYQRYYIKKADYWIVQTEHSKIQMNDLVNNKNTVYVVFNSISESFSEPKNKLPNITCEIINKPVVNVLVPSAFYKHKQIHTIPKVISALNRLTSIKFNFTLTIPNSSFEGEVLPLATELNVVGQLINIGSFEHSEAFDLYNSSDIVFLPSILEVFSTAYIEAISCLKPLVVADEYFSRDICASYPIYFKSNSIDDCATKILDSLSFYVDYNTKKVEAERILNMFGTQSQRVHKIINLLESVK
jgi:hypothetical protein